MSTGRIKPKYNPKPTARERSYHIWLYETFPCACGCGQQSDCFHHTLTRHPKQRWRRDHEYGVPMTDACHRALHDCGNEAKFRPDVPWADLAYWHRNNAIELGKL